MRDFFIEMVWARAALPSALIVVHLVVTILAVLSIASMGWIVQIMGLEGRLVPGSDATLGNWLFDLEIIASVTIIIAGMLEAVVIIVLEMVSDCVTRLREIGRAWRSQMP
jgi:hypothetical protein